MGDIQTLTEFLPARFAEDEELLRGWLERMGREDPAGAETHQQQAWRSWAEIAKNRLILRLHTGPHVCPTETSEMTPECSTMRALGMPYAEHPDYQIAWRPGPARQASSSG